MPRQTSSLSRPLSQTVANLPQLPLIIAFLIICLSLSILSDRFLTPTNIVNILRQSSINALIAVGMTLVILTAGIDLSVGSILGFTAVMSASILVAGLPPLLASLAGMAVGAAFGMANGVFIVKFSIPPFIATLGTLTLIRGLALSFTGGSPVSGLPEAFRFIGTGFIFGLPVPVVIMIAVIAIFAVLLNCTSVGERLYALGTNPKAALFTGISTGRYIIAVYTISGLLSALAGQILVGRLNSAQPTMGAGYEFNAIAAVVLGGTSFSGGRGGITGTIVGVLILVVINNGLNLQNISAFWEQVIRGSIIIAAILLNRLKKSE